MLKKICQRLEIFREWNLLLELVSMHLEFISENGK